MGLISDQYYYREVQHWTWINSAYKVNIYVSKLSRVISSTFWETCGYLDFDFDNDKEIRNFKVFEVKCWLIWDIFSWDHSSNSSLCGWMAISPGILKNPTMHTQLRPLWYFWPEMKYCLLKFFLVSKVRPCTCIHAYMHTQLHTYMHTCVHAYMHTCVHAYIHTCKHAYMPSVFTLCHLQRDQIIGDRLTYLQREFLLGLLKIVTHRHKQN